MEPAVSEGVQQQAGARLARKLKLRDAVFVGLGAMLGAGIFSAIAPAAEAAGSWLLVALAIAAAVALCNALSSAQLAALYSAAGGTYVYGRERLSPFWGFLAGWGFVVGKTASCAAMALTFGLYVSADFARLLAVAAVLAFTAAGRCSSSPLPATRASPPSARKSSSLGARSRARSRSRWVSPS